ncbi:MAG TPA: threonine synthase [Jiangellaceae bacterium]|nr:threonine synthase [Jiangellaceae bacterium]
MNVSIGPTGSALAYLEGGLSGRRYQADEVATTDPEDGRPLLARYDFAGVREALDRSLSLPRRWGLWRWAPLLPVRDWQHVISLGEGSTPLLPVPRLGAALGCPGVLVKAEGINPTGSFKARGMAVAVSRAVELNVRAFVMPSAGNAGGALAAYAAAAGADATVLMPADVPPANQAEVLACGAQLILVDGLIDDCGRLSSLFAERTGAFDVSTLKEPYRVEGKKTLGFELAEDLEWELPDVIVYPTGGGTGLVGMWKAFAELEAVGLISERRPRMVSVQAEGCAPIVRAFHAGQRFADRWEQASTRAGGIRVPRAVGDFLILDAVRDSGGTAVAVPEDAIDEWQRLAGQLGAGFVSPETAAAFAAVRQLRERGDVERTERVVVFDTGIGHKYPSPPGLPTPPVVDAHVDVDRLLTLGR